MKLFSGRNRPFHLGPYPQECLRRYPDAGVAVQESATLADDGISTDRLPGQGPLSGVLDPVAEVFDSLMEGSIAPGQAPLPDSPVKRAELLKSVAYFFDAALVGVCRHEEQWVVVIATEPGPSPESDNLASDWITGSEERFLDLRAAEIAQVLGSYLRNLGFCASGLSRTVDQRRADGQLLPGLAQCAGVLVNVDGELGNPFLGHHYGLAAVFTELELAEDAPLVPRRGGALAQCGITWLLGTRGTRSALGRWWNLRRASHMSRYPMERIRRVARATTRVDAEEIPQVPLRASFFNRAAHGDLGPKAQAQFPNFVMKEPLSGATRAAQGSMVPLQQGEPVPDKSHLPDPEANARALKSLGYYFGTDLIGICPAHRYTWYSHDGRGEAITEQHRYAIVLLIDQGFETMDGASGDDWISGSQSMRGYLRGMEIATLIAAHIRSLGYRARAHSNVDGQVLQIPLILHAGLGELSRIGEVVLNPFVGPRFKSAVVTTDLPLTVDQHIDFGLQDMCDKCRKCARECPVSAISWGDKVMFNGYEMWKPDVERCTRYRLTNARGSACGRCMKTCPYNHEGLLAHQAFLSLAIHAPWSRRSIAALDDRLGNGKRNPVKKWWQDLEIVDGVAGVPAAGVNERDLSLDKTDPHAPVAYYNADVMPPGDTREPVPLNRKAAVEAVRLIETPEQAARRIAAGTAPPAHYQPPDQPSD